jgi:hypothetical protein
MFPFRKIRVCCLKEKVFMEETRGLYTRNLNLAIIVMSALELGYSKVSSSQGVNKAIDCQDVYTAQTVRTHALTTNFLPTFMVKETTSFV